MYGCHAENEGYGTRMDKQILGLYLRILCAIINLTALVAVVISL